MPEPLESYSTSSPSFDVHGGVRFSAILLVLLGCALGLCGLFCLIAVVIVLTNHGRSLTSLALGTGAVVLLAASLACVRAAMALRNGRLWGANVATVCGGLTVAMGGLIAFDFFHARGQVADEYFIYPLAPIFLVVGAWLCIYLNMPRVRSDFDRRSDS